ncbi:MAG: C10 family peptidase [Bacteroidota bacterium]
MQHNKHFPAYIFIFIFSIATGFAKIVPESTANLAATHFIKANSAYFGLSDTKAVNFKKVNTIIKDSHVLYYEYLLSGNGFIFIAADDIVVPVLAYSNEKVIENEAKPIQFTEWMNNYNQQIEWCRNQQLQAPQEITDKWVQLVSGNTLSEKSKTAKNVDPLLPCIWDQSYPYNMLCPVDAAGNGGHVYAGCTATAMAQIMYFFRFPQIGTGYHSYVHPTYGLLEADFDTTDYHWNSMIDGGISQNHAIALLQYHCGVAVEMDYAPDGSGAGINMAGDGLKTYFGYSQNIETVNKSDFSSSAWLTKIKGNIDNNMPIEYAGYDTQGGGGHAFVLDGYQGTDYFHFNWGWSGSYNGFYYLTALNPASYNFINWQQAVFNIYPASNFPYFCSGLTTLTNTAGTIDDGSGPENYQNNSDCKWLIAPTDSVSAITLSFKKFDTESGFDKVIIYNGGDTTAPVLATYSGTTLPAAVTAIGNKMLIRFKTNGSNTASGWYASYTSTKPIFCSSNDTITAASGTIDDGSGPAPYNNMTNCKWFIAPQHATSITLHFNSFNLENGGDFLRIYNPLIDPPEVLGTYTGTTIPSDITSSGGKMLLAFFTNNANVNDGWEATYSSVFEGIEENTSNISYHIYPNPTSDIISITSVSEKIFSIDLKLYNIRGGLMLQKKIKSNSEENLSLASLSKGIYILKLTDSKETITKKIIIQ